MLKNLNVNLVYKISLVLIFVGCGSAERDSIADDPMQSERFTSDVNPVCDQNLLEREIRLKGVGLLSRTFTDVLGTRTDVNITNPEERLFETYRGNFGGNEGLGYGDLYADNLNQAQTMTSYFLALNFVARNAALQCASRPDAELCACDDKISAQSMLERAIPSLKVCSDKMDEFSSEFTGLCQQSNVDAITTLMASIAIAKRH